MFFGFCFDRNWTKDNPAKKIKMPRNIKPNEVVPFTTAEIVAILEACDTFGKVRLRTSAGSRYDPDPTVHCTSHR